MNRLLLSAITLCVACGANAENFGYCTDVASRSNIFRIGESETQGMAMRLSHEKIQALKGCPISGISALFGSMRAEGGTANVFVSTTLSDTPSLAEDISIPGATKWVELKFTTPYVITGDEPELYVGYTARINPHSSILMADFGPDSPDCTYLLGDAWVDAYGLGYGNASVRAIIGDAPAMTDVMLRPIGLDAYFKAQTSYALSTQVFNFGTSTVNSFDVTVEVHDAASGNPVVTVSKYSDLNLAQGQAIDITLPEMTSTAEGTANVAVTLSAINGSGSDDIDPKDNGESGTVFFYPAAMERSILLEGFTGQQCHNCPEAHATIERFIESAPSTPVIEVMHHAGYTPDFMTMSSDVDCTFFYGKTNTYAPAMMLNRTVIPSLSAVPVMNVDTKALTTACAYLEKTQPYVSLSIESDYDPETRQVHIVVRGLSHRDLPEGSNVVNVMLVQNAIVSIQTPYGSGYTHNAVSRGTLFDNSWGMECTRAFDENGSITVDKTFILPEGIFSDYYDYDKASEAERALYTIPAVAEDMYIVAYVGHYDPVSPAGHEIYNAVTAPLGKSHIQDGMSAVCDITTPDAVEISVCNGRVTINGDYDSVSAWDVYGRPVDLSCQLSRGIYVVSVVKGSCPTTKKIIVK